MESPDPDLKFRLIQSVIQLQIILSTLLISPAFLFYFIKIWIETNACSNSINIQGI